MTKLHEILAVEDSLATVFSDSVKEAVASFSSKDHLFKGHVTIISPLEEDVEGHMSVAPEAEQTDVAETVRGKLDFVLGHMVQSLNVYGQKEEANQRAKADLIIGGVTIIKDCPATALLGLETRLKQIRSLCDSIKTMDTSKGWVATQTKDVMRARSEEKFITKKVQRERVVIPPTEHQAGQFTTYSEDVRVGKKVITHLTGLLSPVDKSNILTRVDQLIRAVKKARQRANTVEVNKNFKIGKAIKDFLLATDSVVEEDD